MVDQETTNIAALAIQASSPDAALHNHFFTNPTGINYFGNKELSALTSQNIWKLADDSFKMKERDQNILNESMKSAKKSVNPEEMINDLIPLDNAEELADIFISDEALKQLMSKTDSKEKKPIKQAKHRAVKSNRKIIKEPTLNEEPDTNLQEEDMKTLKPSLRPRKSNLQVNKAQLTNKEEPTVLREHDVHDAKDKAENNNWMVADEESIDIHKVISKKYYTRSKAPYLESALRQTDCQSKITTLVKPGFPSGTDVGTRDASPLFKHGNSSDDSGCLSNQSALSTCVTYNKNGDEYIENKNSSLTTKTSPCTSPAGPGICSACGNNTQSHGNGLCKACKGRIRHECVHIGALGELRAYAQSIADSVKKILTITPRHDDAVSHHFMVIADDNELKISSSKNEEKNVANLPGSLLQKCKTQISMTPSEDIRIKNILNKSVSFDGRVTTLLEEGSRSSPMYWGSHEKTKIFISNSTIPECEEEKLLLSIADESDHSVVEGDYFSSNEKGIKHYINHDDHRKTKLERLDRGKKKTGMKQMLFINRVRTEGSACESNLALDMPDKKLAKYENKKDFELTRSKSKFARSGNLHSQSYSKPTLVRKDEMNALRLKLLCEGSPVDPLETVLKKKGEESKDRKSTLLRSVTAPDKKHMPKKENLVEERFSKLKNVERAKTLNSKPNERKNKSPPLRKVESISFVRKNLRDLYEPLPDSWKDESSVKAVLPFTRRRSTSYDGRKRNPFEQDQQHRSLSRSATDKRATERVVRKRTPSTHKSPVTKIIKKEIELPLKSVNKFRYSSSFQDGSHSEHTLSIQSAPRTNHISEKYKTYELQIAKKKFPSDDLSELMKRDQTDEYQIPKLLSSTSSSYFEGTRYYGFKPEKSLSADIQLTANFSEGSYYGDTQPSDVSHQLEVDKSLKFEPVGVNAAEDDAYHKQMKKYDVTGIPSKTRPWYSLEEEERALIGRDRSHESKSSTSFHKLTAAKSSHSDVALMKQGNREHTTSRRQSMYSETDVDSGLIYHFAIRQTTRAHVPAYHDLTSNFKDIYTMSGDVSTSASSNSASSNKSESSDISECAYTGGFFHNDPFYENDTKVSSCSSAASSSVLYFEPENGTKQEASELNIYTGAIFSSSQNALSLSQVRETMSNLSCEVLKDGSTNNSTRPPAIRNSRRFRYRPHIDVIRFKMFDSTGEFLSKSIEPNNDFILCNISNNSYNYYDKIDDFSEQTNQMALCKYCISSADYAAGAMPFFTLPKTKKPTRALDVKELGKSKSDIFFSPPSGDGKVDSIWCGGFTHAVKYNQGLNQSTPCSITYSWQNNDDYYKTKLNKINNTEHFMFGKNPNMNNNRLDDTYTDFSQGTYPKTYSGGQANNPRRRYGDSWYAEQPTHDYSPTFFVGNQPTPVSSRRFDRSNYKTAETSVFGQASAAYSESSEYEGQGGWQEFDNAPYDYVDEPADFMQPSSERFDKSDKYGYFPYSSSDGPPGSSYMYDKNPYDVEQKYPSSSAAATAVKKVGGIVCRDNVINKEDYAEDINRDLEQVAFMPLAFVHDDKPKHQEETFPVRQEIIPEINKFLPISKTERPPSMNRNDLPPSISRSEMPPFISRSEMPPFISKSDMPPSISRSEMPPFISRSCRPPSPNKSDRPPRHAESSYNQNRIYDNDGTGKKWREMGNKRHQEVVKKKKDSSKSRAHAGGDSKRQDYIKTSAWNPPDNIPDKALGKRMLPIISKPTVLDGVKGKSTASNVVSSVTSIPSRLTNYVKKWF